MGKTLGSSCKCNDACLNNELTKEDSNEAIKPERGIKKRNHLYDSYKIDTVVSETITSKKISEENLILNISDNLVINDGLFNSLTCISESLNNSFNNDNNDSIKSIENQKSEKGDIKISRIGKKNFQPNLFNKQSIRSMKKFNKLLSGKEVNKQNPKKVKIKVQNENIMYNGEQGIFNGELIKTNPLNGKGVLQLNNGKIYEGEFVDGMLNNYGKYTDEEGTIYEGVFKNGILNGKAKIITLKLNKNSSKSKDILDTVTYNGDVKDLKKEGLGKEVCNDYIYEGEFHNNMKNGKGKIKYIQTGDTYEGEFKNDEINGNGTYKWINNSQYTGNFKNGKMNGEGTFKWPDGSEYSGEYVNGIKNGIGQFQWSDGNVFKGVFKNGKPSGLGLAETYDSTFNVKFKNGKIKTLKKKKNL